MDKSMQGKMVGAAVVLGLSVGIGAEKALSAEAKSSSDKDLILLSNDRGTPQNPNVFKFAVDPNKPGAQAESSGVIQKHDAPSTYKLTDVIVSSAKSETSADDASKPAGKANNKPRHNARKRTPN